MQRALRAVFGRLWDQTRQGDRKPSLLEKLAVEGTLICPRCGSGRLRIGSRQFRCRSCSASWPVSFGVPDFFNNYRKEAAGDVQFAPPASNSDVVERIRAILDLPKDSKTLANLEAILRRASTLKCDDSALTAEISDVMDRFFGSNDPIEHPSAPAEANRKPKAVFERHYLPDRVSPGQAFSANVRLRNAGAFHWSSRTPQPLTVQAAWIGGTPAPTHARLPIDVRPGQAITLPLRLQAPPARGAAVLEVSLHSPGGGISKSDSMRIPLLVEAQAPPAPVHIGCQMSYADDHQDAVVMLKEHLGRMGKPSYRVLEVGCGTHPQMAAAENCEVIGLDISAPLLELGSLYFHGRFPHRFGFVCADAFKPPFLAASFDVVVMFSTLHHFPEPEQLLRKLATLLKLGGVVAVLCEPVGDTLEATPTVRDLLKGINEQVFSLDEYRLIFDRAGLHDVRVKVDGGSLKAILRR